MTEKQAPKLASGKHLGYLDGLRAFAAIFVVIHHALLQVDPKRSNPLPYDQFIGIFYFGRYAVDLFIVLSGFCLMLPIIKANGVLRNGAVAFFKRRAWRILPPYYLAMALSLLLVGTYIGEKTGTHWDSSLPVTAKSIITHLFLVHDAFGEDASINHVFWSIAVEWRIYFLFPLLVVCYRRFGSLLTTALTIVASAVLLVLCKRLLGVSLMAHYIGLFAMGMLAATIAFSPDSTAQRLNRLPWSGITLVSFALIVLTSLVKLWKGELVSDSARDYLVGFWSLSLLVMLSHDERNWLTKLFSYPPLVFIGTFAYSIYLIHSPLLQVFWQSIFSPLHGNRLLMFAASTFIGTPLIIGLSYVFFLLCEKPFLQKGRSKPPAESLATKAALEPAP